jgi:hypothetical protein
VAAPTFQAIGTFTPNNATPASVPWPAHLTDDIGLLIVEHAHQPMAAPSGWAEVVGSPQGTGTAGTATATGLSIFWKRAASAAEANASLAYTGNHVMCQILTARGAWTGGTPVEDGAGDATSGAPTAITVPGATTVTADTLVVVACSSGRDAASVAEFTAWANANLGSLTERIDKLDTTANGGGFGVATGSFVGPGAYGATTATLANAFDQGRISVAIRSVGPTIKSLILNRRLGSLAAPDFSAVRDFDPWSWNGGWQ